MTAFVDVRLLGGLALPYVAGAEAELARAHLDPLFAAAWQGLLEVLPGLSLQPLFDGLPVEQLMDLLDAVRLRGEEPPDLLRWFAVPCDDAVAELLVPALQALPLVELAALRPPAVVAGTVSWGTNPEAARMLQLQPAPHGVDAIHVWQVPGGTGEGIQVVDVEHGWRLDHEDLISANVRKASVFGSIEVDHGTAVAGIVVGDDNGVGGLGIVPDAALALVTDDRGGVDNSAAAIVVAGATAGIGGVVLLELATPFFAGANQADLLLEFHPPVQAAIRFITLFGVTVVEPAGNGGVDLDAFPALAHTRPGSPTFVDSHAIVVGAAELSVPPPPAPDVWQRTFSTFGSRVDCFAAGSRIRAPSSAATDAYQYFTGTSGASAIVAGVVAAIQGMALAATGDFLHPVDVRRLFRDPALGTTIPAGLPGGIGSMPNLRAIARSQGWTRVLPVGAAAIFGDSLVMVHLDADDRLVRRHWTFFTGWGSPLPLDPPGSTFALTPARPAVLSAQEFDPLDRLVHEVVMPGPLGLHHLWWDSQNQNGDLLVPVADFTTVAQGRAVAAVRATVETAVIAAVNPQGRLVVLVGDAGSLMRTGLAAPLLLDAVGMYRRVAGPALVSRAPALADIVLIEDGGTLRWFTGTTVATIGTGWSAGASDSSGTVFEPGAQPDLIAVDDVLLVAGVGVEGWLRVTTIDPVAGTIAEPAVVDVQVTVATSGPVALGLTGENVVVLAVDTDSVLRASTRPRAGGEWTPLVPVDAELAVSPLGGVTAVTLADLGVMALAVRRDGVVLSALSRDGLAWPVLQPLP